MSKYRYITNSGRSGYYKKWNDSKFSNIPNLMDFLVGELVQIYDADQAGNKDLFIRVKNDAGEESWYVIEYYWYIESDPEWNIVDGYNVNRIDPGDIPKHARSRLIGDRDWIIL